MGGSRGPPILKQAGKESVFEAKEAFAAENRDCLTFKQSNTNIARVALKSSIHYPEGLV
jgi:hypothetical protein